MSVRTGSIHLLLWAVLLAASIACPAADSAGREFLFAFQSNEPYSERGALGTGQSPNGAIYTSPGQRPGC